MRIDFKLMVFGLLMATLFTLPPVTDGQTAQQNTPPIQQKPKVMFSQNMELAAGELKWSQTYYLSFQKTKEAIYLKLAATHCTNAVKVLMATQKGLPNTTRFYYLAKNRRFTACRFFQELQETALRLDPRHHISDMANKGCDF